MSARMVVVTTFPLYTIHHLDAGGGCCLPASCRVLYVIERQSCGAIVCLCFKNKSHTFIPSARYAADSFANEVTCVSRNPVRHDVQRPSAKSFHHHLLLLW